MSHHQDGFFSSAQHFRQRTKRKEANKQSELFKDGIFQFISNLYQMQTAPIPKGIYAYHERTIIGCTMETIYADER